MTNSQCLLMAYSYNRSIICDFLTLFTSSGSTPQLNQDEYPAERQITCNGYASMCDRKYSNITFVDNHDSAFVGNLPTENQRLASADTSWSAYHLLNANQLV